MSKRRGASYQKRVADINKIYDLQARRGLTNREIWRRYIYPLYAISERTFYNLLNASCDVTKEVPRDLQVYLEFNFDYERDEPRHREDHTADTD